MANHTWQRIHLDFAGPFLGRMFLITVDTHSKWPEVEIMPSTTSTQTIDRLRTIFARYGVPAQVVTDNGPQFTSAEFQLFLKINGIKHITTAPFHPATNGQAERFVQSFKHAMKCEKQSSSQLKTNMAKFFWLNGIPRIRRLENHRPCCFWADRYRLASIW